VKIVSVMSSAEQGGAWFSALGMLDALVDRGNEVVMLTDQPGIDRETGIRLRRIEIGPKLSARNWPALMLRWRRYLRRLRKALESEAPYDVLLVHHEKEQLMARYLPKRLRPALVWAAWGPVPFPLRRGLPRWLYLGAARRADRVIAISSGTRVSLCDVGLPDEAIEVVPNAVRTQEVRFTPSGRERVRRQLGIPDDAFVVGCVSRFHPKKRNDVAVDAVKLLGGQAHLVLAGHGHAEPDLRTRARSLGDRAHFIPTPGSQVVEVLSAFDLLVFCPSPTEGASLAVVLGMLTERPCLATAPEGVADLIADGTGEIISPENDPCALARSIRRYMEEPDRLTREGAAARRRAVALGDAATVGERIQSLLSGTRA
jgi:glycosyltransferase involved in cell wall biosynthesis